MTQMLQSEELPEGHKLEEILQGLRADILKRCDRISMDTRPEALHVMQNNVRILELLTEAMHLALDSTATLDKAFGPSKIGQPRIGVSDDQAA